MIDISLMRTAILKIIVTLVLIANSTWPMLTYAEGPSDNDHQLILDLDGSTSTEFDEDLDCDHCCHMNIHLLGMLVSNQIYNTDLSNQALGRNPDNYPTGFPSPPYHPPTV